MIVTKGIRFSNLLKWSGPHIIWLLILMTSIAFLYEFELLSFSIPWLPISVIGTAVAFYVGFKNNQAYDRMWEARKIWGGIVNDSRSWGMLVNSFVSNLFIEKPLSENELHSIKQRLIYRHIGWLYTHRNQLLAPTSWEHISQGGHLARTAEFYQRKFGVGLVDDQIEGADPVKFLSEEEFEEIKLLKNKATQLINSQGDDLAELRKNGLIDDFRHMEMAKVLQNFYTLQGKNERIKKFPLPRQYANMSRYFVGIFIALLPFSMIPELMKVGDWGLWLSIPITALIGWVYVMMEIVGDYSENPFQGMANDIPMLSLCRTIEIDLREMLGETDLPASIESKNGVLM
ncbi:bestrophin family protein [Jiulongibacter sediminis]|uniref:bestrophin family protein n=1 Tax=Jiulongibacter sediminis TaxID=1605367 RepID=UPI0026EDB3C0|nr:bestrophin family ion channel [Jiulongibacter sediminis]